MVWYVTSTGFHNEVEKHGLSVLEWRVLSTLAGRPVLTISELAQVTVSKQPTVTRLLVRLDDQGLISRTGGIEDRRHTNVRVTAKGKRLVSGLNVLAHAHEQKVAPLIGEQKLESLKVSLREIIIEFRPEQAGQA